MTKSEILAKAKREYPIGTKYLGAAYGNLKTSEYKPRWVGDDSIEAGMDYVYYNGTWAKIISHPKGYLLINHYELW